MDSLIKCPFCKSPFAATQLVSHCKECPQRRSSGGRPQQPSNQQPPQIDSKQSPPTQIQPKTAVFQPQTTESQPQQQINLEPLIQPEKLKKPQKPPQHDTTTTPTPSMSECPICARKFASDRLETHQQICEKASTRKVKVFDAGEKRLDDLDSESRRLVQKVDTKSLLSKKKEINEQFTAKQDGKSHFGGGEVEMFGQVKVNFKPYSDEEEMVKPVKNGVKGLEFVPPQDGPIDDVEHVHVGGPRLPRTPTSQQQPYAAFSPEQIESERQEVKQVVAKAEKVEAVKSPEKKKHKHKHKHKSSKGDMMEQMQQMFQQMQSMQFKQQQPQQYYQPQYQPQPQPFMVQNLPPAQFQQSLSATPSSGQVQFCFSCGSKYIQDARFCAGCGTKKPE